MKAAVALDDLIDAMSTYIFLAVTTERGCCFVPRSHRPRSGCVMPERNLCLAPDDLARVLRTTVADAECMQG